MSTTPSDDRCQVTLACGADGRAEVHKRASSADQADRLAREAAALRRARHPGVVDLVALRRDPAGDGTVLVTRSAGTHTLATWPIGSFEEVAGILVVLAETLADLHHLGIAHGAIEPAHVIVDGEGRPVLCGFDRRREHRLTDDIAGLGRLAQRLVRHDDPATGGSARREPRRRAASRRRLAALADQACDPDEQARPGARRFAAAVLAAVPDATIGVAPPAFPPPAADHGPSDATDPTDTTATAVPDGVEVEAEVEVTRRERAGLHPVRRIDGEHEQPHRSSAEQVDPVGHAPRSRGRVARTSAAVLGIACLVFGGLSAWSGERPRLAPPSVAAPAPLEPSDPPTPAGTAPVDPSDPCLAAPSSCPPVLPGGSIVHEGSRFSVGGADDQLLVADGRCPDPPTIALLRPADGTTWLYDRWAGPGEDVDARPGPTVAPGSRWYPTPLDPRGCAALAVRAPDGTVVPVDPTDPGGTP